MPSPNLPFERRATQGTHKALGVLMFFGAERGVFAGMLRDISEGGAKIQLGDLAIPRRCLVSSDNFFTVRQCRRVWRNAGFAGLAFEGATQYPDESSRPG